MSERETVFVAEKGAYADRYVAGVFRTLEEAQGAFPGLEWATRDGDAGADSLPFGDMDGVSIELYEIGKKT